MAFAPPNPADRVGQFVASFEDRMLLAWEALAISQGRLGTWSQYTVVEAVDAFATSVEDFDEMADVLMHAAESTFGA